ncbi:hypothetical protein V8E54_013909 [Elaphomyces granulatus]
MPDMNTTTANKPKRELPAFMELILEDGAENTPWGDLYWRMFGRPDGSLGDEINQEALDNWDEIIASPCPDYPKPLRPLPESHWPLTHAERIRELESLLNDERFSSTVRNIRAAIRHHRSFDQNALCGDGPVYFQNGRVLERNEIVILPYEPFWMEGILRQPLCLGRATILLPAHMT